MATVTQADERFFSDNKNDFLTDPTPGWWSDYSYDSFMDKITNARAIVFNHYFPGHPASKIGKRRENLMGRLDNFEKHLKGRANKCAGLRGTAKEITRRSADDDEDRKQERSLLNEGVMKGTAKQDLWAVWWAYGIWIREGILKNPNCSNDLADQFLRRVDRFRYYAAWQYCELMVEPEVGKADKETDGFCHWIRYWNWGPNFGEERPHPNDWEDLNGDGKYSRFPFLD